jgi:hypothetical protein
VRSVKSWLCQVRKENQQLKAEQEYAQCAGCPRVQALRLTVQVWSALVETDSEAINDESKNLSEEQFDEDAEEMDKEYDHHRSSEGLVIKG